LQVAASGRETTASSASSTQRSTALRSSRTLPGQSWASIRLPGLVRDRLHLFARLGVEFRDEARHQLVKVGAARAQAGQIETEHRQPVEQVGTKAALRALSTV
jgi:hypothetical protein